MISEVWTVQFGEKYLFSGKLLANVMNVGFHKVTMEDNM